MDEVVLDGNNIARKKSKLLAILLVGVACLVLVALLVFFIVRTVNKTRNDSPSVSSMYSYWQKEDYQNVYDISNVIIEKNPLNIRAVIFHGYSAFYLALGQSDVTVTQSLLDEAINCLRFAIYYADRGTLPQLYYMLGKAYFQKNNLSSFHYYSDLVIKYLELARENGYSSSDITEYLGLCYADLDMLDESLTSFTQSLTTRETDSLLLAIAKQYHKKKQDEIAKQYLVRINEKSVDDDIILQGKLIFADILFSEGDYSGAKKEYEEIIAKDQSIADAYFGLGNVYEKLGDTAKARSEWRKVLKAQVNHAGALYKLGS